MAFRLEAFQNRFLAPGQTRVDAILSVTVDAAAGGAAAAERDQVVGFILDKSGSMAGDRMNAAKHAIVQAVHVLRPATWFFVVAFDAKSQVVVPAVRATEEHKRAAEEAIDGITTGGGTAMSTGLARGARAHGAHAERHPPVRLSHRRKERIGEGAGRRRALRSCSGVFQCDCWGVGTDWRVGEVQNIARALLGKASIIPEPAGIEAAFRAAMTAANAKSLKDVRLRLWTPQTARIALASQVNPTIEDLAARGREVSPQVHEYFTGAWSHGETRDFHVAIDVKAGGAGDEMLACRPSIAYLAPASWRRPTGGSSARTRPPRRASSRPGPTTARCRRESTIMSRTTSGQDELAQGDLDGLELREQGDDAGATQHARARRSTRACVGQRRDDAAAGARWSTSSTPRRAPSACDAP